MSSTPSETATITGYNGEDTDLAIPSEIGGYPVTAIGDGAFASAPITSVTVPSGVESIGYYAFGSCASLISANLPGRGIDVTVVPRLEKNGVPVSASAVRALLHKGKEDELSKLVPLTTLSFLKEKQYI